MDKTTFPSTPSKKRTPTTNAAGGAAYKAEPKLALAKSVLVGTLAQNAYTPGSAQVTELLDLCEACGPEFVAKAAVYARTKGNLKDIPLLLTAWLAINGHREFSQAIAGTVMPTGLLMRNFIRIFRSGVVQKHAGKSSIGLGSHSRNLVRAWFNDHAMDEIYRMSSGNDPSMRDVLRLVKPRPSDPVREQFYGFLVGKKSAPEGTLAAAAAAWYAGRGPMPDGLPFEMAAANCTTREQWADLARGASWNATIKNLNTFARHGLFTDRELAALVAARLRKPPPRHVMPWSVYAAYLYTSANNEIPMDVRLAVQDALDNCLQNVPTVVGNTAVLVDTSGSMTSPVTGQRGTASTKISCSQAAMLIAAAYVKNNPGTRLVTFDNTAREVTCNPRDSVATIASRIPFNGGGTNVSAGLDLVSRMRDISNVLIVSDNESWIGTRGASENSWKAVQRNNPGVRLACLDVAVESSLQIPEGARVMHLSGAFSDYYWPILAEFFGGTYNSQTVVRNIEDVTISSD